MKKGYYITSDGITHPIKSEKILCLSNLDIIKLILPDGVKDVWCDNNNLSELKLPDSIKRVYCYDNNNLSELTLPDGVETVWCENINIHNLDIFFNNEDVRIHIDL